MHDEKVRELYIEINRLRELLMQVVSDPKRFLESKDIYLQIEKISKQLEELTGIAQERIQRYRIFK